MWKACNSLERFSMIQSSTSPCLTMIFGWRAAGSKARGSSPSTVRKKSVALLGSFASRSRSEKKSLRTRTGWTSPSQARVFAAPCGAAAPRGGDANLIAGVDLVGRVAVGVQGNAIQCHDAERLRLAVNQEREIQISDGRGIQNAPELTFMGTNRNQRRRVVGVGDRHII